ncbi:Inositol 2-dehydrogenase [Anatilimnocola aggregata]|uniref:Inositol 2-dehydrogenase n=1 Tax=Anatilimnocola aggregata TaxID=2528021 RepID=A0A517YM38_9BACT|nr:Gfo/Idh/MocA family oxidoreductase [Anatilimnocola aggregata]QDU31283.1 Inositol 2-dehydrogenase [Anatilimnocola aggregata]
MSKSLLSRRTVLKAAAASSVFPLFTIAGTKASGKVIGANDTIRIGVAGIKGRGGSHIDGFAGQKNVEVACLIDPDSSLFESRTKHVNSKGGNTPKCVQDIRKALEDKTLDAISVATTNHWHSLITIWACQAGKDVYVEKPISHNVWEGRKCVEAAKKYNRVVQHGTQRRSSSGEAKTMAAIHSGDYGKLLVSKGYCCKSRWSIGTKAVETPPSSLDFDIWNGPAPKLDFHRNLVHYNWHWFWETGNGDIGNQGVHEMDVARWAIKDGTLPTKVWTMGGRFLPDGKDQGETPNQQLSVMEFGDTLLVFETRGLTGNKSHPDWPTQVTNEFYMTDGVIKGGKFYAKGSDKGESLKGGDDATVAPGGPFGSFTAAMRSRNPKDNNADAETAHYSAALCHLANISYRLGKQVPYSKTAPKEAGDNKIVHESFAKIRENCAGVGVKLDNAEYTLGRTLTFDPAKEQFVGDDAANLLLTRPYRAPYVVPEKV